MTSEEINLDTVVCLPMSAIYVQANIMTEAARMETEKRRGDSPVPDEGMEMLNELQRLVLHRIEGFGWRLHFI